MAPRGTLIILITTAAARQEVRDMPLRQDWSLSRWEQMAEVQFGSRRPSAEFGV